MMPKHLEGRIIRSEHLRLAEIGDWFFEDEKIVFITPDGAYTAYERPENFSITSIRVYCHRKNAVGYGHYGGTLWLFGRNGQIRPLDKSIYDRDALGAEEAICERFYPRAEDLVFLSDVGAYLFREGELAWSIRFLEHGGLGFEIGDYLSFTPQGLSFAIISSDRRLCRWSDGRVE